MLNDQSWKGMTETVFYAACIEATLHSAHQVCISREGFGFNCVWVKLE